MHPDAVQLRENPAHCPEHADRRHSRRRGSWIVAGYNDVRTALLAAVASNTASAHL